MNSTAKRRFIGVALIALGLTACYFGIQIGQADDAPGAGMLGIVILVGTVIAAFRLARKRKS